MREIGREGERKDEKGRERKEGGQREREINR